MATMNISLPDQMKKWVEAQVETGKFANSSDFVRDVLRERFEVEEKRQRLRMLIQEGEDSGVSDAKLDDIWKRVKARYEDA